MMRGNEMEYQVNGSDGEVMLRVNSRGSLMENEVKEV